MSRSSSSAAPSAFEAARMARPEHYARVHASALNLLGPAVRGPGKPDAAAQLAAYVHGLVGPQTDKPGAETSAVAVLDALVDHYEDILSVNVAEEATSWTWVASSAEQDRIDAVRDYAGTHNAGESPLEALRFADEIDAEHALPVVDELPPGLLPQVPAAGSPRVP